MMAPNNNRPAQIIEYTDPLEGFKGWLVIDSLDHRICAGGMRVQPGLTADQLIKMASNMNLKMRIAGLRLDGAKSGIDYDPSSPGKHAAMARFLKEIKPYIETVYSMGPDLNVDMVELENTAKSVGIPSVKMAVAQAQGMDLPYFLERLAILEHQIGGWTLGSLRAGYGVAIAALAVLHYLKKSPDKATIVIQGFGTLARAAALTLHQEGARIIAFADAEKTLVTRKPEGFDLDALLQNPGPLLPQNISGNSVTTLDKEAITEVGGDILIPVAIEGAINSANAGALQVQAIVPGANLAITPAASQDLHKRGILVLPDFLAGCGGSLSMDGLFGPPHHPRPEEVLTHIRSCMENLVQQTLIRSSQEKISPTQAALHICSTRKPIPETKPYGPLD